MAVFRKVTSGSPKYSLSRLKPVSRMKMVSSVGSSAPKPRQKNVRKRLRRGGASAISERGS
jgi:hypothetical protein